MRKILARVNKTDWILIGVFYSFVIPMVFVQNGLEGEYDMFGYRGLLALGTLQPIMHWM